MNNRKAILAVIVTACLVAGTLPSAIPQASAANLSAASSAPASLPWPKTFDVNGAHIVVYQPQLKSWRSFRTLVADTAVSITPKDGKPVLGVITFEANTLTNVSTRTVVINNIKILDARIPSLDPAQEAAMREKIHQFYPTTTLTISIDRMIASLNKVNAPAPAVAASTQVPVIFYATSPAIVLLVDSKPVLAPIQGTTIEYVVNTNWDLFYDKSDYYLLNGKTWLKSKELTGRWIVTTKLPPDISKLPADQNWGDVLKAIPPAGGAQSAPKIFFTEKPAELILFKGQPAYAEIPGTSLSYATNTQNSVFVHEPDKQVYVLLSGRWFRAASLEGPWSYAGNDLPSDFAMIPPGKPYSSVLVSLPGTQAASDAVMLAQVPTTAIVNRAAAESQVKVAYAGDPVFTPIPDTAMAYAANTPEKVIRVGDLYYLCFQGVWFVSTTPNGPWKTADTVPQVIYTIPPSSPVYNVTYVTVSNPTPTTVESSYSAGYMGMFVIGMAVGATLVYGTGYYYPPYVYWGPHPIYYPYPYTYGCFAVYNPYTGGYAVGRAVYGPYGSAGSAAWYNPATGRYGHATTYQNAYGGHTYASTYNPWTGTYAATSQGHNQYSQWGSSVVQNGDEWARAQHVTNSQGTAASFQTSKGSEGAGYHGSGGNSGFVAKDANNNNVYAGHDGNVYKKSSDGTYSKWENGSWVPVTPPDQNNLKGGQQSQNPGSSQSSAKSQAQQAQQNRNSNNSSTPTAQSRNANPSGGGAANQSDQRANRPSQESQPGKTARGNSSGNPSSETMKGLQNDSESRSRGAQMEQSRNRGAGGGFAGGHGAGGGGGGRGRR
ncbi:MAG TPA: hypothetical protein VEU52_09765 [Candidatus Limnocylindrales bacterium]|nr:hypothetical protein [Candidatus Limnocylindrales bacterium]